VLDLPADLTQVERDRITARLVTTLNAFVVEVRRANMAERVDPMNAALGHACPSWCDPALCEVMDAGDPDASVAHRRQLGPLVELAEFRTLDGMTISPPGVLLSPNAEDMTSEDCREVAASLLHAADLMAGAMARGVLSREALDVLRRQGVTRAEWIAYGGWSDGAWHGDRCGCTDDRCAGFHHDEDEPCGCLPVLIDMHLAERVGVSE